MYSTITFIACFFAFLWAGGVKKRNTQLATVLLALSSLIEHIPLYGLDNYGGYAFVFFSFFAAIETFNSLRMTVSQRMLFLSCAIVILFFELAYRLSFPFHIPKYPFAMLYLLVFFYTWKVSRKKIHSRLGVLIVWSGLALRWLLEGV